MQGHRDGRQVEVVEHDRDVMVQASPGVEVNPQRATADQRDGPDVPQPGKGEEFGKVEPRLPPTQSATSLESSRWRRELHFYHLAAILSATRHIDKAGA